MSSLPQGQDYFDLWSFLHAWEERYGELTTEQNSRFLSDPRLLEILLSHKYAVEASLDQFKTFDGIIEDLRFKQNTFNDYVEITPDDLGMKDFVVAEPWDTI